LWKNTSQRNTSQRNASQKQNAQTQAGQNEHDDDDSILLSDLIDKYLEEHKNIWSPGTYKEYKGTYQTFLEDLTGDKPVKSINKVIMRDIRNTIDKYPARRKVSKHLRDKNLRQIFKDNNYDVISVGTKNKYINLLSGLFEYACRLGYMEVNPASRMGFKDTASPKSKVKLFNRQELHRIFHSPGYTDDTFDKPFMFWVPIIGLFTGARLNEICQIHLGDIWQDSNDIWVFDLSRPEANQRVKNEASKRYIPIHSFLIGDLNFIGFKEKLESQGEKRLFPELLLDKESGKYERTASTWFNQKFLSDVGVKKDRSHCFHSFRHTLQTYLTSKAPEYVYVEAYLGHAMSGEGARTYNKGFEAKALYEKIVRYIDFEKDYGLDLSHLKNSKFVVNSKT